jgi:hypothetical protein
MKQIVEVTDVEGLESLLGENVRLMCAGYFYRGKLKGVNSSFVKLENANIIYDTTQDGKATTVGQLPSSVWYIQTAAIESYGVDK